MRIAFVVDLHWAFGRIATAVANAINARENEHGHHADVYHGCGNAPNSIPLSTWQTYDIIYVPEWDWKRTISHCPWSILSQLHPRIVFGAHSVLQFVSMDVADWSSDGIGFEQAVTKDSIDQFLSGETPMSVQLVRWFQQHGPVVGAVSQQIIDALRVHLGHDPRVNVVPTHCGVSDEVVERSMQRLQKLMHEEEENSASNASNNRPLRVIIGTPPNRARHAYDAKRLWIVDTLRAMLKGEDIEICGPETQLSFAEMDQWYDTQADTADVVLCTSHSEGNPLVLIEGGGRGLIAVTTNVGVAPELITEGWNGYIVTAPPPSADDTNHHPCTPAFRDDCLVQGLVAALRHLHDMPRSERLKMRHNMLTRIHQRWRWSVVVQEWLQFFMLAYYRRQFPFPAAPVLSSSTAVATSVCDTVAFKQICDRAVSYDDIFQSFKVQPPFRQIMEHLSLDQAKLYHGEFERLVLESQQKEDDRHGLLSYMTEQCLQSLVHNDTLGSPSNVESYPFSCDSPPQKTISLGASPSTLRYMCQMAHIVHLFGTPPFYSKEESTTPTFWRRIAEIGPGYGGLCWMLFATFGADITSYTAYELSATARLMQKYLKRLDPAQELWQIDTMRYVYADTADWVARAKQDRARHGPYDLVLSHYGLSGCTAEVIDAYVDVVIRESKRGYLTVHRLPLPEIDALADKIRAVVQEPVHIVEEKPSTSPNNRCIVWGARDK